MKTAKTCTLKLSACLLALALLLCYMSFTFFTGQAVSDGIVIEDFDGMSDNDQVTGFWGFSRDPDTPAPAITLSNDGGAAGTKATMLDYNLAYNWSWMYLAKDPTVANDGLKLWIKNDCDVFLKANFVNDGSYVGEFFNGTLPAGEHVLGITWEEAGLSDGQAAELRLQFQADDKPHEGIVWIDDLSYIGGGAATPTTQPTSTTTITPVDPSISQVLFTVNKPNIWGDGDPAWAWRRQIDGDARFTHLYEICPWNDFNTVPRYLYLYSNMDGVEEFDLTPYIATGTLRFWAKGSAAGKKFAVSLREGASFETANMHIVEVQQADVWQEIQVPLADLIPDGFRSDKVSMFVVTGSGIEEGEAYTKGDVLKLGGITVYTGEAPEVTEWDGKDHDIAPAQDDGKMDDGTGSSVLWTSDFGTDPWPDVEKIGSIETVMAEDLPGKMDQAYKWTIGEDICEPNRGMNFYGDAAYDISQAKDNGYLYFWVKSSKANVQLMLFGMDDIQQTGIPVFVTVDKANEWQMVRIRIYDLLMNGFDFEYFNSVSIRNPYPPFSWSGGAKGYQGEGYLAEGDVLYISQMFVSSGKPVDPDAQPVPTPSETESSQSHTQTQAQGTTTAAGDNTTVYNPSTGEQPAFMIVLLSVGALLTAILVVISSKCGAGYPER